MVSKTKISEAVPHVGGAKRLDYIDVAKGVGILLVVIGHLTSPRLLANGWIQNFHMPLFFIISGMLYKPERYPSFGRYVQRKCRVLLKPLLVFIMLNLLLTFVFRLEYYTLDIMLSPKLPMAMWFIFVLLLTELAFYPVAKMGKCGIGLIVVTCFMLSFVLHAKNVQLPLSILSVTVAMGFYGIGFLCKNVCLCFFNCKYQYVGLVSVMMLSLPLLMTVICHERIDLSSNSIPSPQLLYVLSAIMASVALIKLCIYVRWQWLKRVLIFYGKTSITTLCLHICFLNIALKYFCFLPHAVYKVVEMIFVIVMSAAASYTMERWGKMLIK